MKKIPHFPNDPSIRAKLQSAWREGYRQGTIDRAAMPGRRKIAAKTAASQANGKLGGRPKNKI